MGWSPQRALSQVNVTKWDEGCRALRQIPQQKRRGSKLKRDTEKPWHELLLMPHDDGSASSLQWSVLESVAARMSQDLAHRGVLCDAATPCKISVNASVSEPTSSQTRSDDMRVVEALQ